MADGRMVFELSGRSIDRNLIGNSTSSDRFDDGLVEGVVG